jgi:hypothetical protein
MPERKWAEFIAPVFFSALRASCLEDTPVFAEVSVQQSREEDYNPRRVADLYYNALNGAWTAVG